MSKFTIQKAIPIPAKVMPTGNGESKYPFKDMEIGDSFFIPGKAAGDMSSTLRVAHQTTGFDFTARTVKEVDEETGNEVAGCRIWRVELTDEERAARAARAAKAAETRAKNEAAKKAIEAMGGSMSEGADDADADEAAAYGVE
jgi:hypothetical protein